MRKSHAAPFTELASRCLAVVCLSALPLSAVQALQIELDYGEGISGVLNTSATIGAQMRMQKRSNDLLGKANLIPNLCGSREVAARPNDGVINFNSCQGINQNDILPAQALSGIAEDIGAGPLDGIGNTGTFSPNFDDGNWNYDQYDLTQAPLKITQDLSLTYGGYGLFSRWLYFYDFVNNDFDEYHPNRLRPGDTPPEPDAITGQANVSWGGAAEPFFEKRSDPSILKQIGSDFQLMDLYVYGFVPLPGDRELTLKLGRQSLSWGESTLLVVNSVNQSNPINVNNFFRTGFVPEEVFTPVGMLYASTGITDNLSIEAYYQYEWDPLEAPAPGSYFSFTDIGTDNAGTEVVSISFGGPAEDPYSIGTPLNNPLSGLTDSTTSIFRRRDNEARDSGQYGIALKYFAEDFNNGTDFGFYFMNYHSKLPYASFWAADLSCARTHAADGADGDPTGANSGIEAYNVPTLALACPNLPLADGLAAQLNADILLDALGGPLSSLTAALGGITGIEEGLQLLGSGPVTDAVPIDEVEIGLEYPEDLKMYGMSFNTTMGDLSIQGEVAYRPNMPLQVDAEDLTFAALGPLLTSCHRAVHPDYSFNGGTVCSPNLGAPSQSGANTFNLIPAEPDGIGGPTGNGGDAPSVQRSFPSFITSYRGVTTGENDPNGYIRGWEYAKVLQYNLGATYILGKTDNPIGADQVIMFFELGATQILNKPGEELYQIESPGTYRHASAGVVDTDALGSPAANATQAELLAARRDAPGCLPGICVAGTDGMRFNPQQEKNSYADDFAWGWRIISLLRYESILPGISLQPFIILAHDVKGIAPGPGENFIEGRKQAAINFEIRYKNNWAFFPGYAWFTGGGSQNYWRDRDLAQFYVRYQF